ncbi:hypothetical protein [Actinomyces provencensis]|uniref:hypothetical protein n=1 Tax=Actinomyces provencensis TaxID=1720198 RepID=UPI001177BDCE|nr:hypothetical protein [Actinomyces provencensis]
MSTDGHVSGTQGYGMATRRHGRLVVVVALVVMLGAAVLVALLPRTQAFIAERELYAAIGSYDAARGDLDEYLSTPAAVLQECSTTEEHDTYCETLRSEVAATRLLARHGVPTGHDPSDVDSIRDRLGAVQFETDAAHDARSRLVEMVARSPFALRVTGGQSG